MSAPVGWMGWLRITLWDLITKQSLNLVPPAMEHNCCGLQKCSPGFRRAKGNEEKNQNPILEGWKWILDQTAHQDKQFPETRSLPAVSGEHEAFYGQHPNKILLAWWVFDGLLGFLNSRFLISLAEIIIQNKSNRRIDVGIATWPPHPLPPQSSQTGGKGTGWYSRLHQVMRMQKDAVV